MKKLLFSLSLVLVVAATAQAKVPDEDDIYFHITNPGDENYYPSLMLRYEAGDTTLTTDNYHYLYYGFAYQDQYRPLEPIRGEDELLMILERNFNPTPEEAREMIFSAKLVMQRDPFSPKNINFMAFAYSILGDTLNARINMDRLEKILYTIDNSGNGLKEKTPWHVLWFSHTNDFLASRGLEIQKRVVSSRSVEYVWLTKKDEGNKGYYFDFGRVYWKKPESNPNEKRSDGFLLNGIPVGRKRIPTTTAPAR